MFPLQIDYHKISEALKISLEKMKQSPSVPDSALEKIEFAQKQFREALSNHLTRKITL